jgi:hypothetical protein
VGQAHANYLTCIVATALQGTIEPRSFKSPFVMPWGITTSVTSFCVGSKGEEISPALSVSRLCSIE